MQKAKIIPSCPSQTREDSGEEKGMEGKVHSMSGNAVRTCGAEIK